MTSVLSRIVNNLDEQIHKIKCKNELDNNNFETCGIKCEDCDCSLEYRNF